jgi:NADP-dependent 3-hydroxy acid dehydrogenase YdfG
MINMGSIAGHTPYQNGTVYNASKFAVNGYTNASRFDLMHTPLRVTHIAPGLVGNTEFSNVRLGDEAAAKVILASLPCLKFPTFLSRPSHTRLTPLFRP